jgi:hypothetical protein
MADDECSESDDDEGSLAMFFSRNEEESAEEAQAAATMFFSRNLSADVLKGGVALLDAISRADAPGLVALEPACLIVEEEKDALKYFDLHARDQDMATLQVAARNFSFRVYNLQKCSLLNSLSTCVYLSRPLSLTPRNDWLGSALLGGLLPVAALRARLLTRPARAPGACTSGSRRCAGDFANVYILKGPAGIALKEIKPWLFGPQLSTAQERLRDRGFFALPPEALAAMGYASQSRGRGSLEMGEDSKEIENKDEQVVEEAEEETAAARWARLVEALHQGTRVCVFALFLCAGRVVSLDKDSTIRLLACLPYIVGVLRLVALGHSASAIASFDEAWALAAWLRPWLEAATGNAPLGDWFTFHVSASHASGFSPHRDRPRGTLAAGGFRASGSPDEATTPPSASGSGGPHSGGWWMPKYTTVWVALSDATPDSSCLYFLPKQDDPTYFGGNKGGDEVLEAAMPSAAAWASVVCAPAAQGSALVFSHRILHWGSKPQAGMGPGK